MEYNKKSKEFARKLFVAFLIMFVGPMLFFKIACSGKEVKLSKSELHKKNIEKMFLWDGGPQRELFNLVNNDLNDPKSFEHINTYWIEGNGAISIIMTFTAKNGFGGTMKKTVSVESDTLGHITKINYWFK